MRIQRLKQMNLDMNSYVNYFNFYYQLSLFSNRIKSMRLFFLFFHSFKYFFFFFSDKQQQQQTEQPLFILNEASSKQKFEAFIYFFLK